MKYLGSYMAKHTKQTCQRCNRTHDEKESCPAQNKKCRKCNKRGHFEVVCKSKMLKEVCIKTVSDSEEDSFFVGKLFLRAVSESELTIIKETGPNTD